MLCKESWVDDLHRLSPTVLEVQVSKTTKSEPRATGTLVIGAELHELACTWILSADPGSVEGAKSVGVMMTQDDGTCLS